MWSWCVRSIVFALIIGTVAAQYEVQNCPVEDSAFELVTGWMYSAPQDILETRAGTLQLAECIDACKSNLSCLAINFETGLCVLFKSQVGERSGESGKDSLSQSNYCVIKDQKSNFYSLDEQTAGFEGKI
jgi:hypothetical protein